MAVIDRSSLLRVCPLSELEQGVVRVVHGAGVPIAVFAHEGRVYAVDNRCPHMGFPLHKGTVKDGILTCHWHEARFDLASGCTFDVWADDVPSYDTTVVDGVVYVSPTPRIQPDAAYHRRRLRRGMDLNVGLLQAKAILGLQATDIPVEALLAEACTFAVERLDRWTEGMTRLACVVNLYPLLSTQTRYYGLFYALRKLAQEGAATAPRRNRGALDAAERDAQGLKRWLRQWVLTRHRDAAERTLLTAIQADLPAPALADLLFGAASERPYASGGHVFDACNKGWELAQTLGADWLTRFCPLFVPGIVEARSSDEGTEWHHPVNLVEPLRAVERELPDLLARPRNAAWANGELWLTLLGDDPLRILDTLRASLAAGAPPGELAKHVAHAAAQRLARFSLANEVGDWFNPQHTFIYTSAVHQAVLRSPTSDVVRGVLHGALAVYLDRYLNVPPARVPSERDDLADLPSDPAALREGFLDLLNRWGQADAAARCAVRLLRLGHTAELVDTLAYATLREDLDFHTLQVLEAGVRQYGLWQGGAEAEPILVGVVRNLAAQCPTPRAGQQTATIALRLHKGEALYAGDETE